MANNNQQHIPILPNNQQSIDVGVQANDDQTTARFQNMNAPIDAAALLHIPHRFVRAELMNWLNFALLLIFVCCCWPILLFVLILYILIGPQNHSNQIPYHIGVDIHRDAQEEGRVACPTDEEIVFSATVEEMPATERNNHGGNTTQTATTAQRPIDAIENSPTETVISHHSVESQETHSSESSDEDDLIVSSGTGFEGDDEGDSSNDERTRRSSSIIERLSNRVQNHDETHQINNVDERSDQSDNEPVDQQRTVTNLGDDIRQAVPIAPRASLDRARKRTAIDHIIN